MANANNIKAFTAADIEKYNKGLLTAKERHALEKAALDDPFLADALDGYAVSGVHISEDITELKNRLANRTEENKSVPLIPENNSSSTFSWWRVAAMIVLVAGAGLLVYQFGFNKKSNDIAQASTKETVEAKAKDSGNTTSPVISNTDTSSRVTATGQQEKDEAKTETIKGSSATAAKEQTQEKIEKRKAIVIDTEAPANTPPVSSAPVKVVAEKSKEELLNDDIRQKKISTAKQDDLKVKRQRNDLDGVVRGAEQKETAAASNQSIESNYKIQDGKVINQNNVFRGRVTDAHNNALPFSNITNTENTKGTYSDARGYFTLTSPDSILNVQVSSLGFETINVQLLNNVPNNQVLLQEDQSSLSETVVSNKKVNSNRSRNTNMVLEEPEPTDGWSNYDIYLANNLKVPGSLKDKQIGTSGEVELSFEVNKNGEPFNITVIRSLCESCDKEAIRLIKEGPKWKRKAKKGRASVTISF